MKFPFTLLAFLLFGLCSGQSIQKATVSKGDSAIWLTANIRLDHRIFGYKKPDTNSQKMILISVFTNDVENNPYKCPLGSYYQTSDMGNMKIRFLERKGQFIKAGILKEDSTQSVVYFLSKWIEFEK